MKKCAECGEEKAQYEFPIDRKKSDFRGSKCYNCINQYTADTDMVYNRSSNYSCGDCDIVRTDLYGNKNAKVFCSDCADKFMDHVKKHHPKLFRYLRLEQKNIKRRKMTVKFDRLE